MKVYKEVYQFKEQTPGGSEVKDKIESLSETIALQREQSEVEAKNRDRGGQGGACVAARRVAAPLRDGATGEGDGGGAGRGVDMEKLWHGAAVCWRRPRSAIFWAARFCGRSGVSARTVGMRVDPSGTGRCVPRAVYTEI